MIDIRYGRTLIPVNKLFISFRFKTCQSFVFSDTNYYSLHHNQLKRLRHVDMSLLTQALHHHSSSREECSKVDNEHSKETEPCFSNAYDSCTKVVRSRYVELQCKNFQSSLTSLYSHFVNVQSKHDRFSKFNFFCSCHQAYF